MVAVLNPFGHGYAEKQGRIQTRLALTKNCLRTLGVVINASQVLLLEGSKPGIRYVLQALGLIGKVGLPMPFYPGNLDGVLGAGCEPHFIPMLSVNGFIEYLEALLVGGFRPVAVVLSFDNPRWLKRSKKDYERLVELARIYGFILISDEAYRDLAYDGKVWSLMQVEGWEQVGFVIQTASKPFSMAGDKLGAIIARQDWIINSGPVMVIKARDSEGGSPAAQKAWATALWCTWYPRRLAQMYRRRAEFVVDLLRQIDGIIDIDIPFGGMFVYFRIVGMTSAEFASAFQQHGFEVSPGERFGEPDRIRWCLNQPNWVTRQGVVAVAKVLGRNRGKRLHTSSDLFLG
jgi:aspartate/methionine/tyrosine aminotransferase